MQEAMVECCYRSLIEAGIAQAHEGLYSKRDEYGGFFYGVTIAVQESDKPTFMCISPKLYEKNAGTPVLPICTKDRYGLSQETCDLSPEFIPIGSIG